MFVLRQEHIEAFNKSIRTSFEDEMVVHSKYFSPRLCEVIGEEQLRLALGQAIDRAGEYGFTNRGPVRLFIEHMFLFGSSFDTDPQFPWAAEILNASNHQMQRAERLYEKTLDYQEKVSGLDAVNTRRALSELWILAQQQNPFPSSDLAAYLLQEMVRIFPQKASYSGEASLQELIRFGGAKAQSYSFFRAREQALVIILMFAFGHGCTRDPLYPWIAQTLDDLRITSPSARAERLEKKACTWLRHVLAQSPEGAPV